MNTPLIFSPDEIAIARARLAKLESSAASWNRTRWLLLVITLFSFAVSYILWRYGLDGMMSLQDTVMAAMQDKTPDEGLSRDFWYIAELRRSIAILISATQYNSMCMLSLLSSVINVLVGIYCATLLFSRWSQGPWLAVEAKLLRWQIEQCSRPSTLQVCPGQPREPAAAALSQSTPLSP